MPPSISGFVAFFCMYYYADLVWRFGFMGSEGNCICYCMLCDRDELSSGMGSRLQFISRLRRFLCVYMGFVL